MPDPKQYTVGWICAITTEFVAAQAFLDKKHDGFCQAAEHDHNCYVLGEIGSHNVVIAALPHGEYGTTAAAVVARDMVHSFPNVRVGLMVGIGGGVPNRKHDVRLGDVVVSSGNGENGGVLQYDFGKTIQNQAFQNTMFLDQPPMALRTALSGLKAAYEMEGHQLLGDVNMALGKIKKRKKYARPPLASDRLYKADVVHPPHSSDGCDVTCGNDEAVLVVRGVRDEEDDDPMIHYGLIASGNQLMKDARVRDKLADDKGVLCFEMEAAGLMNHFPCLVIRGICDYSDSHKNKEWQGFAAMMAAAYAKDLLRQISPKKIEEEKRIAEMICLVQKDLERLNLTANETRATVMAMEHNNHLSELEQWLRPPNTSTNFNGAREKRHEGSGQWFLSSPTFNEWKRGSPRHLWLHGLAGCGKTVLSATIVDHLRKIDGCVTLDFYFDFNDAAKQKMDGVFRSFLFRLYQLGSHSKDLDDLYHRNGHGEAGTQALADCLYTMMKGSKTTTYVILDALDECKEREELLKWMKKLCMSSDLNHVRLIATGRPEPEFLSIIPDSLGDVCCLPLDKNAVNADIRSYVTATLERSPKFVEMGLPQDLLEQIRNKVGDGADGMFRWAACQMASLATCMNLDDIESALETLPQDLNETYRRMLQSIPQKIKKDAMRLLQFLVHTKRPLTLSEAAEVIATQTDEEPRHFNPKRRPFGEIHVLRHCPGLVSVAEVSDYDSTWKELHLAHFSVKEYLLNEEQFRLTNASIVITRACLVYLMDVKGSSSQLKQDFPMAMYAAEYWMGYATSAEASEDVVQTTVNFLQNDSTFQRWCRLYQADYEYDNDPGPPRAPSLYYTCLGGLVAAARRLVDGGADVNAQGGKFGNPLQAASFGGHREIVQFLLDNGAEVNAQGGACRNALSAASSGGHNEIVQLLLDKGAEVNAQGGRFGNALQAASYRGRRETVQLLLDRGAKVNAHGGYYSTALYAASYRGYKEVVQLLLAKGAWVNTGGGEFGNALQAASDGGHIEIVQLLLDNDAEVNAQGGRSGNALQAASYRGHREIVQLLLDKGARVNTSGGEFGSALQAASYRDHGEIVQVLLENGANNVSGGA